MSKLQRTIPHPVSAIYTCEICGKEVTDIDVVSYILVLALPGKNGVVPSFGCDAEQHHGCCEEHAWEALVACHDEHLLPKHQATHAAVEGDEAKMQALEHLRATHHQRPAWTLKKQGSAP